MEIIGESNLKKEEKFIVFKSDGSDSKLSQLVIVKFDGAGLAHIMRRIEGFFEDLQDKIKSRVRDSLPDIREDMKDKLETKMAFLSKKD